MVWCSSDIDTACVKFHRGVLSWSTVQLSSLEKNYADWRHSVAWMHMFYKRTCKFRIGSQRSHACCHDIRHLQQKKSFLLKEITSKVNNLKKRMNFCFVVVFDNFQEEIADILLWHWQRKIDPKCKLLQRKRKKSKNSDLFFRHSWKNLNFVFVVKYTIEQYPAES